jgi:hypothetical protein
MYGNDLDVVLQVISKFIGIFRISYEIVHQSGEQLPRFYAGTEVVHQRACGDEDEVCCAVVCCWVARQLPSQGLRFRLVRRATLQHRSVLRRATARRHVANRRLFFIRTRPCRLPLPRLALAAYRLRPFSRTVCG